jgi:hypothetical protein
MPPEGQRPGFIIAWGNAPGNSPAIGQALKGASIDTATVLFNMLQVFSPQSALKPAEFKFKSKFKSTLARLRALH